MEEKIINVIKGNLGLLDSIAYKRKDLLNIIENRKKQILDLTSSLEREGAYSAGVIKNLAVQTKRLKRDGKI